RVYDLVMTHKLDADDYFIHRVQEACARAGLNFFLIEPAWAEEYLVKLERKEIWGKVVLNMQSEHHDPQEIFHRIIRRSHELGAKVIDPPDVAMAACHKAMAHQRLLSAGLPLPLTFIVDRLPDGQWPELHAEQIAALRPPFVIKPALGYGRRGVILNAETGEDLKRAVAAWPWGPYLLQERIVPRNIGGAPAYFRVYYIFGATWLSWWNCFTDRYQLVTATEETELKLGVLHDLAKRLAQATGMNFFSTEVAQTDTGDFVLIDYVNDQCHLLTQTASPQNGVPDELVNAIAMKLVEAASRLRTT
ncbi:MAG: hypothetical protein K0Q55_1701, partial [Verrucomicrobia bacterium]|nr:hypothetical protein [Verrucomicrobiota bacterium]